MKKAPFFTLMLLSLVSSASWSQTIPATVTDTSFVYCEIIGTRFVSIEKLKIRVDYGEEAGTMPDSKTKDHPTEKRQKFTSMVEAMNYLSADGWQFVQAYSESYGEWSFIHWILRKKK